MLNTLRALFFPENLRQIPHRRLILNVLRSAHLLSISILLGGYFFHIDQAILFPWIVATVATGLSMFTVELYESCAALFEVRGVSVLLKISLLLCIPSVAADNQVLLLIVVIIFSSLISHSTKRIRHKNLLPVSLQQKSGIHSQNLNRRKIK